MKIFNSKALAEIEYATCEAQKIDTLDLMERAASAVSCEIISRFRLSQRIVVFAGAGNNGGQALAVARLLIEQGYRKVEIFLFNIFGKLSYDCDEERKKLLKMDADFTQVTQDFNPPYLSSDDVVVDGLFGAGQPLQGGFIALARLVNDSGAFVISIDCPSGLSDDNNGNVSRRDMFRANLTLAFQSPRLSFFFPENAEVLGDWKVLDIELDKEKMRATPTDYWLVEMRTMHKTLRPRMPFTGKRDYGSVMLFAGSMGMMGAAVLAARAVLRAGAGLVSVHSARYGLVTMQTAVPEAIFEPDRNERCITDMTLHHNHQTVAIGPGIGTQEETINALERLLKTSKVPLVIDADGLNCIAQRPGLLNLLPPNTVITPHVGEFDRLFGQQRNSEDRLKKAIEMARYYKIVIVLKGHHTATIRPNTGRVYFNSTGNPGMATAGSGDVLTGVIAALMAQGYKPEAAATAGVFIHGLAGDIAAEELGEFGVTAGDIVDCLGKAIREILNYGKH